MSTPTTPAKIFYSTFIHSEKTKGTKLIFSTFDDQGFYIYDIDSKKKKYINTCYFALIIEQIPGTEDFFVVGNDKPNYVRIIRESNNYEVNKQIYFYNIFISIIIIER